MKRLTEYVKDNRYVRIIGCKSLYPVEERKEAPTTSAFARLAAYEDIGLTPDEIKYQLNKHAQGCDFCGTEYDRESWRDGHPHEIRISDNALYSYDSSLGWNGVRINYCPMCGAEIEGGWICMTE